MTLRTFSVRVCEKRERERERSMRLQWFYIVRGWKILIGLFVYMSTESVSTSNGKRQVCVSYCEILGFQFVWFPFQTNHKEEALLSSRGNYIFPI